MRTGIIGSSVLMMSMLGMLATRSDDLLIVDVEPTDFEPKEPAPHKYHDWALEEARKKRERKALKKKSQ